MLSSPNAREIREAIRAMLSIPSLREVLGLGTQFITAEILTRDTVGNWPAEPVVRGRVRQSRSKAWVWRLI